jgi:peptidyl-prolyl cis-trans isomerase A (cyclophilin A)
MAARAPGTATADFFICIGEQPSFDADPANPKKNPGFAAFGQVVDGMDTAKAILASPTSPTAGSGAMKGQMLSPPVPILTARRVAAGG